MWKERKGEDNQNKMDGNTEMIKTLVEGKWHKCKGSGLSITQPYTYLRGMCKEVLLCFSMVLWHSMLLLCILCACTQILLAGKINIMQPLLSDIWKWDCLFHWNALKGFLNQNFIKGNMAWSFSYDIYWIISVCLTQLIIEVRVFILFSMHYSPLKWYQTHSIDQTINFMTILKLDFVETVYNIRLHI